MESANLALNLAILAEKKAIIISKATENAATVQGKAWCMAKQKTEDAAWEALKEKTRLNKSTTVIRARLVYDQNNWRNCILQP